MLFLLASKSRRRIEIEVRARKRLFPWRSSCDCAARSKPRSVKREARDSICEIYDNTDVHKKDNNKLM